MMVKEGEVVADRATWMMKMVMVRQSDCLKIDGSGDKRLGCCIGGVGKGEKMTVAARCESG